MRHHTSTAIQAATWVLWGELPSLILDGAPFKSELPVLRNLYQRLRNPKYNVPSNWSGIEDIASRLDKDSESYIRQAVGEDEYAPQEETSRRAREYVDSVRSLATRWRLAESWGPHLIHELVRSSVTYEGGRFRPPAIMPRRVRLTLEIEIDPMTRYDENKGDSPVGSNALAPFYKRGERIPWAEWRREGSDYRALLRVREAREVGKYVQNLLQKMEADGVIRLRKTKADAYRELGRNVLWFYLNHCEGKSAKEIADQELEKAADALDESVVYKGIAQVEQLLSLLRVS